MNTRELLEKSAKAAGYNVWVDLDGEYHLVDFLDNVWNPLESDGDTFRLKNKLRIIVYYDEEERVVMAESPTIPDGSVFSEPYGDDIDAATRLAITRAAAAMWDARNASA